MDAEDPVVALLREVVAGQPPAEDGGVTALPPPPGPVAGVLASCAHLVPEGEPVFVQVAPGNVASRRATRAAGGYVPIGAELMVFARRRGI